MVGHHEKCLTFYCEGGGARSVSVVIFGLAAVDAGILREDFKQQQRVFVSIVKELTFEAGGQKLGVFVPEHLRLGEAGHLHRETNQPTRHRRLGLHVSDNLRKLRH